MQNEEHIQCPSCGNQCRIRPEHMGRRVACPKCKQQFTVPPPPPLAMNEVVLVVDDLKTNAPKKNPGPPNPLPKKSARGEKWKKPSTLIAFAMLALTLLLPVGMVAMAVLTVASNDRGQDLGNGMYMRTDANGIPDIGWQSNRDSALGIAALLTGVCCPLVPYVILMLILITGYFAFRSAGS